MPADPSCSLPRSLLEKKAAPENPAREDQRVLLFQELTSIFELILACRKNSRRYI
jgi:hypothetical protein